MTSFIHVNLGLEAIHLLSDRVRACQIRQNRLGCPQLQGGCWSEQSAGLLLPPLTQGPSKPNSHWLSPAGCVVSPAARGFHNSPMAVWASTWQVWLSCPGLCREESRRAVCACRMDRLNKSHGPKESPASEMAGLLCSSQSRKLLETHLFLRSSSVLVSLGIRRPLPQSLEY